MSFQDFALLAGVLAAWFVLSRWVLPWLGVPTCASGSCGLDRRREASPDTDSDPGNT